MDFYNYDESLKLVEQFMMESGIRNFCGKYCKGKCCFDCYDSDNSCIKNEGRRLSCSIWVCNELLDLVFNSRDRMRILIVKDKIELMLKNQINSNIYFTPHVKKVKRNFLIDKKILNLLNRFDIKEIKKKVGVLSHTIRRCNNG